MTEAKAKKAPAKKAAAKANATITVRQTKSAAGRVQVQHATLHGLGLKGPNSTKTLQDTPEVRGMIRKVAHLVEVVSEQAA